MLPLFIAVIFGLGIGYFATQNITPNKLAQATLTVFPSTSKYCMNIDVTPANAEIHRESQDKTIAC